MSYGFIQKAKNTAGTGTSIQQAYGSNVTAGSMLVAFATSDGSSSHTFSSTGDSWTTVTVFNDTGAGQFISIGFAPNATGGAKTVTCTFGAAGNFNGLIIAEFSGGATSSALDTNTPGRHNAATSTPTDASMSTAVDGDLILSVLMLDALGATVSAGSGFTLLDTDSNGMSAEYQVQSAHGGIAASFSLSAAVADGILSAALKPAATAAATEFARPWTGPTPGRVGPTGQWNVELGDATTPLNVYVPAEAAATGVSLDATVAVGAAADQAAGTGTGFDAITDTQVDADQAAGTGVAFDATVNIDYGNAAGPWTSPTPGYLGPTGRLTALVGDATTPLNVYAPDVATGTGQAFDATVDAQFAADQTTGSGTGFDATSDVQVQADQTSAGGTAFDAAITVDYGNYAGPWTQPTPGRVGPTGQWTVPPADPTPAGALAAPADQTSATGAAFDATIDFGIAADVAAATGAAFDAVLAIAAAVDNAFATGTALDAAASFGVAADIGTCAGSALDATLDAQVQADQTSAGGTAFDATVQATSGNYAGPWTGPTPGRIGPTGRWTIQPGTALVAPAATGQISGSAIGLGGMEEAGAVSATESASSALSAGIQ